MTGKSITCSKCGANLDIPEGYNRIFCLYCGTPNLLTDVLEIPGVGLKCLSCGKRNKDNSIYCDKCGISLQKKCPFCEEMHSSDIIYCPKTGFNVKGYEKEIEDLESLRQRKLEELKQEIINLCAETKNNMVSIVSTFQMCKYEVTNKEFCIFLNSQGNQCEGGSRWIRIIDDKYCGITGGPEPGTFALKDGYENHPVVDISWYGAAAYCNWLSAESGFRKCYDEINKRGYVDIYKNGYRLPDEGEWEYACRAGSTTPYYWGYRIDNAYFWYEYNSGDRIHPVGEKEPNAFGLYDMSGNVSEWCNDCYKDSPILFCLRCETENRTSDLYCKKCGRSIVNPLSNSSSLSRIHRGGSWHSIAELCQSSARRFDKPGTHSVCLGFRLARAVIHHYK